MENPGAHSGTASLKSRNLSERIIDLNNLRISPWMGLTLVLAVLGGPASYAQPVCSINLGADHTICQGQSVTLQGPTVYTDHLWSNGATTQDITVTTGGDYWCQVSYPSGNLVTNGNFSAGNTGFTSQYYYSLTSVQNEGYYTVGANASWYHTQFQGTGNGNFLIANGGYGSYLNNQWDVWCQTLPCCPGQTYTISFRGRTLSNATPGRIAWVMSGDQQWPDITFPAYTAGWQQFSTTWTAGPGQTSVTACMRMTSGDGIGNDIGVDDISFSSTVVLRDTVHVAVTPLPVFDLGANQTLCVGESLQLDATVPGGTYLWQNGSTAPTFGVTTAGTYSVTVTAQNCPNTDQVVVGFNPLPTVDLGPDTMLCAGSTLILSAYSPGYSYLWQDGSTGSTFTVGAPGIYWAQVTRNNCSFRDSIQVGYKPMPTVSLGNDTAICAGNTLTLDATVPGATYLWQDGSTAANFTVSSTDNYEVEVNLNGCIAQDAIQVTVKSLPVVDLGPDPVVCPGATVTFDATTAGATYFWSDGSTGATLATDQTGNYSVQVTVNGCTASDAITLSNFNLQTVDLGPDGTICAGESTMLGVNVPGAAYLWNTGATTDSIAASTAGTYWVEASLNGCAVRDSVELNVTPLPVVSLGPDQQVCPGGSTPLDATAAGASYVWNNGATSPSITVGAGTWSVGVTVSGCTGSGSVTITELTPPSVDLGPDQVICPGAFATLDATTAGATYLWSDGSTGSTLTTDQPGNYSVQVTVNGCSGNDAITLSYFNLQTVNLGPDRTICAGGSTLLGVNVPGAIYLWNTGATTDSIAAFTAGTYWVEATQNGCAVRDSIELNVTPLPVVTLGPDQQVCPGGTATLDATTAGAGYLWNNGAITPSVTVGTGTWSVVVTANGCSGTGIANITELTPPNVDLGPDQVICPGASHTFDATTSGATYLWNDGSAGPTLTTDQPGNYSVQVTVNGCSASDAVTLSYFNLQTVNLGLDRSICAGESAMLGVNVSGANYLWNTGATSDSISVSTAGTYWVEAAVSGCVVRDSVEINVVALPLVSLGADQQVCPGGTATLDATTAGAIYLWNNGATTPLITAGIGTWSVAVTVNGCTASSATTITEQAPPSVDLGPDTVLCPGESLVLDASTAGATYLWSTGATTASITVDAATTVSVTVTNAQGCSSSAAIIVSYAEPGTLSLGPDITFCTGSQITLDATMAGASGYLWSDGSTNAALTTGMAGIYWVAIGQGQCTVSDTVVLAAVLSPSITLGNDTTLCPGESVQLHVPSAGLLLEWQDGSQADTFLVEYAGDYWVAATNAAGCTDTAFVQVSYLGANAFELGPDTLLCDGSSLLLNAGLPGGTTQWSGASSATTASLTVNTAGLYIATTTVGGCAHSDSIMVSVAPSPTVDLGADSHFCEGGSLELTANGSALLWDDGSPSTVRTITQGGIYWVQASENGCTSTDSITVTEIPLPHLELGPDTALCSTEQLLLDVTVLGATYLWNDGNTNPIRSLPAGNWNVEVTAAGCSTSDTIRIQDLPSPELTLPNDTTLCLGDTWTIDVAQPDASYSWSTGATSSSMLVNSSGTYGITVDRNGCVASAQVVVSIVNIDQFSLGADTTLCPGAILPLSVDIPGAAVLWQDGSTAHQYIVDSPGIYQAVISVGSCTAQSAVEIGFTALPQPDLGADQALCMGDTVLLSIDPGPAQAIWNTGETGPDLSATTSGTYTWSNGTQQPTLTTSQPGTYSVSVTGNCIQATDTITIWPGSCTPLVHIPNAFTPDGDGINDRFSPSVVEALRSWTFLIFDRWGELVFSSTDPEGSWDGTFHGKDAPIGVYVWDLHYEANTLGGVVQERLRGSVSLVR